MTDKKPFKLNLWAINWDSSDKNENIEKIEEKPKVEKKATRAKIDFSEMLQKREEKNKPKKELSEVREDEKKKKNEVQKDETQKESTKIEVKDEEKKEDIPVIVENKEELNNKNDKKNILKKENIDVIEDKITPISEKKSVKKEDNDKKNKDENSENIKKTEEIFEGYKSDFHHEENWVLEKISKIKNYIKPKTRIEFLMSIVAITVLWIAALFMIDPNTHNFENYKNNIVNIATKEEKIISKKDPIKEISKNVEEIIEKETILNKVVNKWGFNINYKIKKLWEKETILYRWEEFDNFETFNKLIEKEVNDKKRNKLKNHITNKDK